MASACSSTPCAANASSPAAESTAFIPSCGPAAKRITVVLLRNADSGPNLGSIGRQLRAFAAGNPFPRPAPVNREIAQLKAFEGHMFMGQGLDHIAHRPQCAHQPEVG
jgi:hypothetical protein